MYLIYNFKYFVKKKYSHIEVPSRSKIAFDETLQSASKLTGKFSFTVVVAGRIKNKDNEELERKGKLYIINQWLLRILIESHEFY